jgi:hypothetical protein
MQAPAAAASATPVQGPASLPKAAGISLAMSIVANAGLYFVGSAMGAYPADVVMPDGNPMSIVPVMMSTVIGTLLATIAFGLMRRFTSAAVPGFRILAGLVVVAIAYAPFAAIQNVSMSMGILLNVMHVVVASSAVWSFTMSKR